ncbi:VUT family protein [Legionella micdadei]|uniref:VUT family protein n=1 Tax=Legionella micdadei TaxID=451 RepID=UPI003A7FAB95
MAAFSIGLSKRSYMSLTVSMMTCLILLINVSFKIIELHGLIFTASSVLCPLVAIIYLMVLRECSIVQQRHILNQCLLALYLFSIGIYLLVNLPAAENMHDNPTYQIVFEAIPKKFFASTIAFAISFYLPHLFCCARKTVILISPKGRLLLALLGGYAFFSFNFLLLFSHPLIQNFQQIYTDSLIVSGGILLLVGVVHSTSLFMLKPVKTALERNTLPAYLSMPLYHYLVSFSVTILLICLACEYRLVSLPEGFTLGASGLLFPLTIVVSNLIGELFGYRANLRLAVVLILVELTFDLLLMGAVALPAPEFFNLNPFYSYILPRRIPAGTLALFVTFVGNAMLLENLKYAGLNLSRSMRILIANVISSSLLCLVNYSLLYGGVYSYDQIFSLAVSSWAYKIIATLVSLPFVVWLCNRCCKQTQTALHSATIAKNSSLFDS